MQLNSFHRDQIQLLERKTKKTTFQNLEFIINFENINFTVFFCMLIEGFTLIGGLCVLPFSYTFLINKDWLLNKDYIYIRFFRIKQ